MLALFSATNDQQGDHYSPTHYIRSQLPDGRPGYHLTEPDPSHRERVESFIRQRYALQYNAEIADFMPRLFALNNSVGELAGAFGLRSAAETLFLECYLDQPIETLIAQTQAHAVKRQHIVEVGQFAGTSAGAARAMICHLTCHLYQQGYHWVVFTGTSALRNAFYRLGLNPQDLAAADPSRLSSAEQQSWGSYYQHQPRVQFGNIAHGFSALTLAGWVTEA